MKKLISSFSVIVILTLLACEKTSTTPTVTRNVNFQLYTNQDFSSEQNTIRFSLFVKDGSKVLFDSALAPMPISQIPNAVNKIIIHKKLLNAPTGDLAVGFNYTIDNVGSSSHKELFASGEKDKTVDYAFQ